MQVMMTTTHLQSLELQESRARPLVSADVRAG